MHGTSSRQSCYRLTGFVETEADRPWHKCRYLVVRARRTASASREIESDLVVVPVGGADIVARMPTAALTCCRYRVQAGFATVSIAFITS